MRAVIADDSVLLREGIATMLGRAGIDVVAQASCAEELHAVVDAHRPDVALIDIRMPPSFTDEGLVAALQLRERHPGIGIVIISQHVEVGTATRLLAGHPARLGYLLKDRVTDLDEFAGSLRTVVAGGSVLDPEVVERLLGARDKGPLGTLSAREREVLVLMAEGRSNRAIGERLDVGGRAVQKHVTSIFTKLALPPGEDDNRRVLAVLTYLLPARAGTSVSG